MSETQYHTPAIWGWWTLPPIYSNIIGDGSCLGFGTLFFFCTQLAVFILGQSDILAIKMGSKPMISSLDSFRLRLTLYPWGFRLLQTPLSVRYEPMGLSEIWVPQNSVVYHRVPNWNCIFCIPHILSMVWNTIFPSYLTGIFEKYLISIQTHHIHLGVS